MQNKITEYIFLEDNNPAGDIAFVFGTGHSLMYAVEQAVSLYKSKKVRKLLFTGGTNKTLLFNEAEESFKKATEMGVPASDILIENRATNTLENVLFSIPILESSLGLHNIKSIVSVVKNFHARRAAMTLYRHLPKSITIKTHAYTPRLYEFTKDNWHTQDMGRKIVFGECHKIKKYLEKDDIEELPDLALPSTV